VLSWGPGAEVLAPEELVKLVADDIKGMIKNYK